MKNLIIILFVAALAPVVFGQTQGSLRTDMIIGENDTSHYEVIVFNQETEDSSNVSISGTEFKVAVPLSKGIYTFLVVKDGNPIYQMVDIKIDSGIITFIPDVDFTVSKKSAEINQPINPESNCMILANGYFKYVKVNPLDFLLTEFVIYRTKGYQIEYSMYSSKYIFCTYQCVSDTEYKIEILKSKKMKVKKGSVITAKILEYTDNSYTYKREEINDNIKFDGKISRIDESDLDAELVKEIKDRMNKLIKKQK